MKNRYGDNVHFNRIEDFLYELDVRDDNRQSLSNWGVTFSSERTIAVNPPGGPFVAVGMLLSDIDSSLPSKIITKIYFEGKKVLIHVS